MRRRKLNGSLAAHDGAAPLVDEPGHPERASHSERGSHSEIVSSRPSLIAHGIAPCKDPDWVLVAVGERLQGAVGDLEDLMCEGAGVGARSRTQIHDAVALLVEALQALGTARAALRRSPVLASPLLNGPLARA